MFRFLKKPIIIILVILVLGVIPVAIFVARDSGLPYDYVVAKRGKLIQEVSVTGRVKSSDSVDLAFDRAGIVSGIFVDIGDLVEKGKRIVSLNSSELWSELQEVKAELESEEAKLAELERGTRAEEIEVTRADLNNKKRDLDNHYDSVPDIIHDVYVKADDAVRIKMSALFSGSKNSSYKLTYFICDASAENKATFLRLVSEDELNEWRVEEGSITLDSSFMELSEALKNARTHLLVFKDFFERLSDTLVVGCVSNDSSLDAYRSSLSSARNAIVTALTSVGDLEQDIAAAGTTVEKSKRELELKLAGTPEEQIKAQEARVDQVTAKIQTIEIKISKTIIRAPIDGIVTRKEVEIGGSVSAGELVVSIISPAYEIETNIPEVDITKVKIGDKARITLDAFGSDVSFEAHVINIEPAERVIEGVATYRTTLKFNTDIRIVKPGMTANIDILTKELENVIVIPQRAVIRKDGGRFVRVVRNGVVEEVPVTVGVRGSEGEVEIISGIIEGDKVVTFLKEK